MMASSPEPAAPPGPHWGAYVRYVLLGACILVMIWIVLYVDLPPLAELEQRIDSYGAVTWIVYLGIASALAVTPVPVTILAVAAGFVFGPVLGTLLSVISVVTGGWGGYWLARLLGADAVRKLLGRYTETVERRLAGARFEAVCTLRLMPGVPYWPVNYGSGAFGIDQRTFLTASLVSSIPGQVSLVAIGALLANPNLTNVIILASAWFAVIAMTLRSMRTWRRRTTTDSSAPARD